MFHRIPQQIIKALAARNTKTILDPFCGSGTVLLEGTLEGHRTIGIDVNPIARLIARVKTTPLPPRVLVWSAQQILDRAYSDNSNPPFNERLLFWFKPEAILALHTIRRSIQKLRTPLVRDFFLVTLASIIRRCSLADPSIAPPVKLRADRAKLANLRYQRDFARAQALHKEDVYEQFRTASEKNIRRMSDLHSRPNIGVATIVEGPAEAANTSLPEKTVDLILTSPPYCGAQKYVRSFRLEMTWLGMSEDEIAEADKRTLGTERISLTDKLDSLLTSDNYKDDLICRIWKRDRARAVMASNYLKYLERFALECRRVIKPGGHVFVTFGTSHIAGITVDMSQYFRKAAERTGLRFITTLIDVIPSRGLITDRHKTAGRIDDEKVVWLQA